MPVRAALKPGQQTPRRPVPATIARPEYVDKPNPQ
ncbi:MAG TPA: type I methionyl aminopeptidase, partial [Pseudonocardiaceae bacterium]|nr:type I methionyl aminopeptidase [Pseudonocardiaceae bacterium]